MSLCTLCPRSCGADRAAGQKGYCGVGGTKIKAARAALHMWEEPCISGSQGSGTVFFSGCPLRCVYCQNRDIARAGAGKEITVERLSEIFLELQEKGAANINLVTPTHYTPEIVRAVSGARDSGLTLPVVYNCGGYEKTETLRTLEGIVDIYLTDFKYMDAEAAQRYSHAPDYPNAAKMALEEMVRQQPEPVFGEDGMMKKGVIVRHLLLPGLSMDSRKVLRYLHDTYGNRIYISIMNQYTPMRRFENYPELNRRVDRRTYNRLVDFAVRIGIENGFIQEGGTAEESFVPLWDGTGL